MSKKPTLRDRINAHCKGCIYDANSGLGTWRQQVEGCTVKSCELYPVRPVSGGHGADWKPSEQPEALRQYNEARKEA